MHLTFTRLLTALLIVIFAIGAPIPAEADCIECNDCTVEAPATDEGPCSNQELGCVVAQKCAGQLQQLPVPTGITATGDIAGAAFGLSSNGAMSFAVVTPETAPPRL